MSTPWPQRLAIPEPEAAARSVRAWAQGARPLAGLLESGLDEAQAATRFGLHLLKEEENADAATVFRAAIALSPADRDLWTNLGVALDRAGAEADAAAALEESLKLGREQPDIWIFLGVVRAKLREGAAAEAEYRTAITLQPDSAAAWQCLGLLKEARRDYAAAIDCLRESIRLGNGSAAVQANLGKLLYQLGRVREAREAYANAAQREPANEHYQRMLRKARFLSDAIDGAPVEAALSAYQPDGPAGGDGERDRLAWLEIAAGLLTGLGHRDAAMRLCEKRVELAPGSASARYLLDALSGKPLDRAPSDYIVENFDAFAERYDAQLVGVLGYDVPEQLVAAMRKLAPAANSYDALDAGCGTGLCGPLLRPLCRTLTGVDLSAGMLARAERRGVYDALLREELVAFLARHPAQFDLIVAADVLLYFGDLRALFAGAALALRPGGLFGLSIELDPGEAPSPGYRVLPAGRFAHAPDYVRAVAAAGFDQELCLDTTLRLEAQRRVRGNLFLFRRRPG